jgi:hypothetical protein
MQVVARSLNCATVTLTQAPAAVGQLRVVWPVQNVPFVLIETTSAVMLNYVV